MEDCEAVYGPFCHLSLTSLNPDRPAALWEMVENERGRLGSVHGVFQARVLEQVVISYSRDLSYPGIEVASPALQEDSLPLHHLGSHGTGTTG